MQDIKIKNLGTICSLKLRSWRSRFRKRNCMGEISSIS